MKVVIYFPEGEGSYTKHVDASDVQSHLAGNSEWAHEARLLQAFDAATDLDVTDELDGWRLDCHGTTAEGIPFARYSR